MAGGSDYDTIVVGGGPAGMVAATLLATDGWRVGLVDALLGGGRLMTMETVHDLPAADPGVTGPDLASILLERTIDAGVDIVANGARAVKVGGAEHIVEIDDRALMARAIVIATGTSDGHLGIPGEDDLLGRGVSHCASCDGPMFAGGEVFVVGDGDWAVEEALILAKYASQVTVVGAGDRLFCSRARGRRLDGCDNVAVLPATTVVGLETDDHRLVSIRLRRADEEWTRPAQGVIPLIGQRPNTEMVDALVDRDPAGFLLAHDARTSVAGVLAAGDVIGPTFPMVASAFAEGVVAARVASGYLAER